MNNENDKIMLKGTVPRAFRLHFFYQTTSPGPNRHAQEQFEFFPIFVELLVFVIGESFGCKAIFPNINHMSLYLK